MISILVFATKSLVVSICSYLGILGLMIAFPILQTHLFYLHRVKQAWFKDLNIPEAFGFLPGQVTSFSIPTSDGEKLHAWHILPLGAYRQNQDQLLARAPESKNLALDILQNDPEARLVIYFHGTAGCIASGWRPESYRALSAAAPDKIHVLTADYRGYGLSSGTPSEEGLLLDGIALVKWATQDAGIPPSRIVIFGQSLGTAVAVSVTQHLASLKSPVKFSGMVLVAPFSDVATLMATYRIAGVVPVLSPLAWFPRLLAFFTSFLANTWMTKDRIAELVRSLERGESGHGYHLTLIHAEDDPIIGCAHSDVLFWHAITAATSKEIAYEELECEKRSERRKYGHGGWSVERKTPKGLIRQERLRFGVHDTIMTFPTTSLAILRAFQATDPGFGK
ncbi:Alpha/Beta hydrolase protein [Phyllosticta capitalensis]